MVVTPTAGGAAYQSVDAVADAWFTQTDYKGAFGQDNWLEGLSWLSDNNYFDNEMMVDNDFNIPLKLEILGNYPNPFNPNTNIKFNVNFSDEYIFEVINILG
tara:strand:+ start:1529 stop:1834 length:306 start_codon:yes stop_codon:yes gene_type:complete